MGTRLLYDYLLMILRALQVVWRLLLFTTLFFPTSGLRSKHARRSGQKLFYIVSLLWIRVFLGLLPISEDLIEDMPRKMLEVLSRLYLVDGNGLVSILGFKQNPFTVRYNFLYLYVRPLKPIMHPSGNPVFLLNYIRLGIFRRIRTSAN